MHPFYFFFKYLLTSGCISGIIQLLCYLCNTVVLRKDDPIMITFNNFITQEGIPIYLQIVKHIKSGIVSGAVKNGDEVPSRRVLSALLGINPNTIQKAYKILEDEGLMESRAGAKSYMIFDDKAVSKVRGELLENDATAVVNSLKSMGLSKEEALYLIEKYWE